MAEPEQQPRVSHESGTGYRIVTHDFDVPDQSRGEPSGIRAQARETGTNKWNVSVTHGPYSHSDESGSYYRHISTEQFEGPLGKLKPTLKRHVTTQWKSLKANRKNP